MKILPLSQNYNPRFFKSNYENIKEITPDSPQNENIVQSPIEPDYYRAISGIEEPLSAIINLPDDTQIIFEINKDTKTKFLSTPEGKLDKELLEKFMDMYYSYLTSSMKRYDREIGYYRELARHEPLRRENKTKISDEEKYNIYLDEFQQMHKDGWEFTRGYISNLKGQTRTDEIDSILEDLIIAKEDLPQIAYAFCERVFEMSKNPDGSYDFSDIDEKFKLTDHIVRLIEHFGESYLYLKDEAFSQVINSAKDKEGKFDFALAHDALDMIMSTGLVMQPEFYIKTIQGFYDKDPKNRELTRRIIWELHAGAFMLADDRHYLEDLIGLCFDKDEKGEKLNPIKVEVLSLMNKYMNDWIYSKREKALDEKQDSDYVSDIYYKCCAIGGDLIKNFFKISMDEEGNFRPKNMTQYLKTSFESIDWM